MLAIEVIIAGKIKLQKNKLKYNNKDKRQYFYKLPVAL